MTTPKRVVNIPTLGRDFESAKPVLQALVEAVETGQRMRPEIRKSFVRVEDLIALNLLRLSGKTLQHVQPDYAAVTFLNSWVNFDATTYAGAGYYRDALGRVHLRGFVKNGSAIATTVFTLPAGFRPAKRLTFAVNSNSAFGRVDVLPDGQVQGQAGSTTSLSLNEISFVAVQ